ncbi:hypothetical protein CDAR_42471 [Caerostris darwini]|uniref:Uncharacterized protein n=1 Tax=Caerostris darwini TaxID=1538125 RepID=A0AAV4RLG9_9ARAC|nr:hypothetical protein CDAR_42471 [Caerostris darwini]
MSDSTYAKFLLYEACDPLFLRGDTDVVSRRRERVKPIAFRTQPQDSNYSLSPLMSIQNHTVLPGGKPFYAAAKHPKPKSMKQNTPSEL